MVGRARFRSRSSRSSSPRSFSSRGGVSEPRSRPHAVLDLSNECYLSAMGLPRCLLFLAACFLTTCGTPTEPRATTLAAGRWVGSNACLSVTETTCDLSAGCGHGHFPKPTIRSDGTFDVDGTYRIEVGPISINPPPPAHFSGSVAG